VLRKRFWALLLVGCLVLGGCSGEVAEDAPEPSHDEVAPVLSEVPEETVSPLDPTLPVSEPEDPPELVPSPETPGLTSANVRVLYVDDGIIWQHRPDMLFDLSKVEHYHEFVNEEWKDLARVVFTTEATVREFSFLDITWNENFSWDDSDGSERLYIVRDVLYTLDELTPEIPLVVTGANLGCAAAANGFSFVDETGTARYFALLEGMEDWEGFLMGIEF